MSGHSKWSQIKRDKGVNDVKRGAIFTKMGREIAVAARSGGGDPDGNFRLRLAIEKARAANMPIDTIKRAVEKATGGGEGEQYEEIVYEGYGPGGVALLVEAATDNRNRTAAEVRSIFTKAGGQLAVSGAVAWQFEQRGVIAVPIAGIDPDEVTLLAIDAGASDVETDADPLEIYCEPGDLESVRQALEQAGVAIEIVLGIDPGTAALGYGVIDRTGARLRAIDHGAFHTPADLTLPERLLAIHSFLLDLIELHAPTLLGVERIFHSRNVQTALAVGHARGVVLLAAAEYGVDVREATPSEVKVAVTGYGAADKAQVASMVATILGLAEVPTPDDAADALAIAIWTAHRERPGERLNAGLLDRGAVAPKVPGENAYERAVREALRDERRVRHESAETLSEPVR